MVRERRQERRLSADGEKPWIVSAPPGVDIAQLAAEIERQAASMEAPPDAAHVTAEVEPQATNTQTRADAAQLAAAVERPAASTATPAAIDPPPPFVGAADDPLARAREIAGHPGVEYEIGWRTPVLGQAWAAMRQTIHDEARLYVDALMARQSELDAAMIETIDALRAEVAELRRRLEERG